jgi:hypothetical protein
MQNILGLLIIGTFGVVSCNRNQTTSENNSIPVEKTNIGKINSKADIRTEIGRINDFLKQFEERSQTFQVSVDEKYAQVKGKQGTIISINPADLIAENGRQIGKTIEIELKELTNQEQLLRASAQTTSNGQILVSGGAYFINITSNGQHLKLKEGKSLLVEFPKITSNKMSLFYGKRDTLEQLNWQQTKQKFESKTKQSYARPMPIPWKSIIENDQLLQKYLFQLRDSSLLSSEEIRRIKMRIKDRQAFIYKNNIGDTSLTKLVIEEQKKNAAIDYELYKAIEVKQLGWINCDRFYDFPNKTNLQYAFSDKDSVVSANVFLVFKDINSVMKCSYFSFENKKYNSVFQNIPVAAKTQIIAFSIKNNKIYTFKSDLTIKANDSVQLTLKETNQSEIGKLFELN